MLEKKRRLTDYLHLFVFAQFAFAQPVLYRLSRKTVYLEDQGIEPRTILLFIVVLCLFAPALLCLLEGGAEWIGETARRRVHDVLVFFLLAAIAMPVLKLAPSLSGLTVLVLSVVVAALALFVYRRFDWARSFVTFAAPTIAIFPAHFLFLSPVSRYLFPRLDRSAPPVAVENPIPVVVVIFDEFCGTSLLNRSGVIDAARYPNFAALAETATWYRNATSVNTRTESAVPAILTGNYPRSRRPATLAEHPTNLFTLLDSTARYDFVVFEPYTRLCRPRAGDVAAEPRTCIEQWIELVRTLPLVYLWHLFPDDTPFALPFIPTPWDAVRPIPPERPNSRTGVFRFGWNVGRAEQFDQFLDRIEPADKPTLYLAHIAVPHFPWCYLPSGRKYLPDNGLHGRFPGTSGIGETWGDDELTVLHGYQRYLLQVGYADSLLGKLMDRLRAADLLDRCLFVAMADHGVSFRPHRSRRIPDDESLPDVASIPLLIKLPGQLDARQSDRNVESIDVLPTILDVLQLGQRPITDGQSLLEVNSPERSQKHFFDEERVFTLDAGFPSKQSTLTRMFDLFDDGSEPNRLFRIGPHNELVGQSVETLSRAEPASVQLDLLAPSTAPQPDEMPYAPCFFTGRIKTHDVMKEPVALAIAVNGIIQAVTRTYFDKRISDRWSAMVPEAAFLRGSDNCVQIFAVTTTADHLILQPALAEPLHLTLAE